METNDRTGGVAYGQWDRRALVVFVLGMTVFVQGCGSGYEFAESNGHVYVQHKDWWKKIFFGP